MAQLPYNGRLSSGTNASNKSGGIRAEMTSHGVLTNFLAREHFPQEPNKQNSQWGIKIRCASYSLQAWHRIMPLPPPAHKALPSPCFSSTKSQRRLSLTLFLELNELRDKNS